MFRRVLICLEDAGVAHVVAARMQRDGLESLVVERPAQLVEEARRGALALAVQDRYRSGEAGPSLLRQVRAAAARSVELAREIAELARLIKGYGDTARRGIASYRRIESEIIEPALAGTLTAKVAVDAIANARVAALGDPDGDALSRMLAALASTLAPMHRAAE